MENMYQGIIIIVIKDPQKYSSENLQANPWPATGIPDTRGGIHADIQLMKNLQIQQIIIQSLQIFTLFSFVFSC